MALDVPSKPGWMYTKVSSAGGFKLSQFEHILLQKLFSGTSTSFEVLLYVFNSCSHLRSRRWNGHCLGRDVRFEALQDGFLKPL